MKISIGSIFLCTAFIFLSCKSQPDIEQGKSEQVIKYIPSVCIEENAWVLTAPTYKSSRTTVLSLGEKVIWLGINVIDSTDKNKEFFKVMLSDSSEGWTRSSNIITNAKPAAVTDTLIVYQRPEISTITDQKLAPMDFIVLVKTQDNWAEIVSGGKEITGWISNKNLTYKEIDIVVALQYLKIKDIQNDEQKKEKIFDIIDDIAFENSQFIPKLRRIVVDIVRRQQDQEKQESVTDSL